MKKVLILLSLVVFANIAGCAKNNADTEIKSEETAAVEEVTTKDETTTDEETSDTISDDLYDFEIKVEGKKYSLPFEFSEMKNNNWKIEDRDANLKLGNNQYSLRNTIKNGDKSLDVRFINFTPNEVGLEESMIAGISLTEQNVKSGINVELAKGINFKSTMDDVIKAYGEPTQKSDTSNLAYLTYSVGVYESIEFVFNTKDNSMYKIDIKNLSNKPKVNKSETQSKVDVPKRDLGTDVSSKNFEFDGVVYTLPASLGELASSGWTVQDGAGEKVASRRSKSGVTIRKGNVTIKVTVENDTPNEANVEDCTVTSIEVREENKTSLKLPNGIQIGSAKADINAAFNASDMKVSDSTGFEYYNYKKDRYHIEMIVHKEKGYVTAIRVYEL